MTEVMRLLEEKRQASGDPKADVLGGLDIPQGVLYVIGQRLNRLSEECQEVLTTAAVIGRQFDFRMLGLLSQDITEDQLLQLVDEALDAYLIQEIPGQGDVFEFSHALVQQTLRERLSTSRRVRLHARVAESLETLYGDQPGDHASELAYHFAQAEAVTGSDKVVRYSFLAGERALESYAWEEALDHFRRGLTAKGVDLTGVQPASDQIAADLLFGRARAQLAITQSIQLKDAVTSFTRAFDYFVSSGEVERAVAIAVYPLPLNSGYVTGMGRLITRVLDLVPADSLRAGHLQASYGRIKGLEEGEYAAAGNAFNSALDIARQNGDSSLELQTLSFGCDVDGYHLKLAEAFEKGLRAVDLARRIDNPRAELMAHWWCFVSLSTVGNPNGAAGHAEVMLPLWERLRHPSYGSRALGAVAWASLRAGDFNTAREFTNQGLAAAPGDPNLLLSRVLLEHYLGNLEEGSVYLDRFVKATRQAPSGPSTERSLLASAIPAVICMTGFADRAPIAERTIRSILDSSTVTPSSAAFARIGSSLLCIFRRDGSTAADHYIDLTESHASGIGNLVGFPEGRLLGLLAHIDGRLEKAVAHFEDGLAFCRLGSFRPALAWTCHDYAEALLYPFTGSGRNVDETRVKVASLLNEALSISSDLGMRPLMERVVSLQVLAADRLQLQPTYPGGLTEREVEVLTHLAQGKTNREIARELVLSERTVQRHISNIYAKIQVRNRAEATTFALSHLPSDPTRFTSVTQRQRGHKCPLDALPYSLFLLFP